MAVVSTPAGSVVNVQYQIGTESGGAPIARQKSFPGIKTTATDQDIYDVVSALFDLLQYPIIGVRRDDRNDLTNQ